MAVAHVRGGGEYGEDWHLAGQKRTKLNTVFDFIACAQYLVDQHYTAPKYLAGRGRQRRRHHRRRRADLAAGSVRRDPGSGGRIRQPALRS